MSSVSYQGRIQDFKLGGGGVALKKIAPSGGRREHFWGISYEKSRFYAKKSYFFPIAEGGAKIVGVFRVKNHDFTPKNHIFSNFRGARAGCAPCIRPCIYNIDSFYEISFHHTSIEKKGLHLIPQIFTKS
jgi:hypothetical protein